MFIGICNLVEFAIMLRKMYRKKIGQSNRHAFAIIMDSDCFAFLLCLLDFGCFTFEKFFALNSLF